MKPWPEPVVNGIKFAVVAVLLAGLVLESGYQERRVSVFNICRFCLILYSVTALIISIITFADPRSPLQALTADGAVAMVLWFNRRSLNKFRLVVRIVPRFSFFLAIFLLFIIICAAFGPPIYGLSHISDDDDKNKYFDTFADSLWSVFAAITSSSFPTQFMPSYREYRDVAIYIVTVISVGSFGLLNILIVVVLVEFQRSAVFMQDKQKVMRQILLTRAFEVLDKNGVGYIDKALIRRLFDELYLHYADFRKAGIPKGFARDLLIGKVAILRFGIADIDPR